VVSITLDFFAYREGVKRAILAQEGKPEAEADLFVAGWLAYALSLDGTETNPPLSRLIGRLSSWAEKDDTWASPKSLGAMSFLGYLFSESPNLDIIDRIISAVTQQLSRDPTKFSPLNDPEQFFPVALFAGRLEDQEDVKSALKAIARRYSQGNLRRRLLYDAALRELGEEVAVPSVEEPETDEGDILVLVWWWERYGDPRERPKWWAALEGIKDGLSLYQEAEGPARALSAVDLALLYEALTGATSQPNPDLLFNICPLHPRVRRVAESLFIAGEHKSAVEEAAKALNEFIQQRTGSEKGEAELVKSVLKGKSPKLQLTALPLDTVSGLNEQNGLALIADGIFTAFRNPKAHIVKDDPRLQMDALEGLEQLMIISYVFKRVERGTVRP